MIFFLYVPTESGQTEMAALNATQLDDAIQEAEALPYAGRLGYLFDGDLFRQEIQTANSLDTGAPLPAKVARRRDVSPLELPRPG